jgi:hypothetical protein
MIALARQQSMESRQRRRSLSAGGWVATQPGSISSTAFFDLDAAGMAKQMMFIRALKLKKGQTGMVYRRWGCSAGLERPAESAASGG